MDKKKNTALIAVVMVLVIGITSFVVIRKNDSQGNLFKNLIIEMLELYPYADNRRATDDSEMIMDWNPNGGGTMRQQILDDTIEGIKFMNRKLGFSNSLFGRMADTTAAMGIQSEENDDFIVTWSFNSYTGLEVIYSKK